MTTTFAPTLTRAQLLALVERYECVQSSARRLQRALLGRIPLGAEGAMRDLIEALNRVEEEQDGRLDL